MRKFSYIKSLIKRTQRSCFVFSFGVFALFVSLLFWQQTALSQTTPYPPSPVIWNIIWDFTSHIKLAPGSDNWPITWADDDHQYTTWGDGGGFGGTNSNGRVSLSVARVEGTWDNYKGYNVWGGINSENPSQFGGKSYGIISIGEILYMWWGGTDSGGSDGSFLTETRVGISTDHSKTWTLSTWKFVKSDLLYGGTFLNFGKDYAGARDNFVYSYFPRLTSANGAWGYQKPGKVDLARVPKDKIMDKNAYEFFAGFDNNGIPTWMTNPLLRQPVFEGPEGVRLVSVTYNAPLGRYFLTNNHTDNQGNLGIFDAPNPWGPWTTVAYLITFPANDSVKMGKILHWSFWTLTPGTRSEEALFYPVQLIQLYLLQLRA